MQIVKNHYSDNYDKYFINRTANHLHTQKKNASAWQGTCV